MSIPTALTSSTAHTTPRLGNRHHVVVIGSGFGGLAAAKRLARADTDVTVVANTTHHLFQPLLYQVASGVLSEGEVAPPTREILRRQRNVRVLLGHVSAIDLDRRTVTSQVLGRTTLLHYDSLIVAAGARPSYFGNDQFAPFAPSLKTVDDALELRGRIFGAFELAELGAVRGEDVSHLLTFTVIGAGPTGVEMAGQIAELARRTLRHDFRAIEPCDVRVLLLDAGPQVLSSFGPGLGARAQRALERLGVEVILNAMVTNIDEQGLTVTLDGRPFAPCPGRYQDLGRRREREPTGPHPRHPDRSPARPRRTPRRTPRSDPSRPPRGLRRGRHGCHRRTAGGRSGGHTGWPIRRENDRPPTAGTPPERALPLSRQRLHGDHQPIPCRHQDRQARADRRPGLDHVAGRAPRLSDRFPQPVHRRPALGRGVPGERTSERTATEQQVFGRSALTLLPGGAADFVGRVDPTPAERLDPASGRQQ